MPFFDNLKYAWSALIGKAGPPPGSYGVGWGAGPVFSDGFRFRRSPSPAELVENFKGVCFSCVNLNANGVSRTPLRLFATTARGQARPKCMTKVVSKATALRLKSLYSTKAMANAKDVDEVTEHKLLDTVMKVSDDLDFIQLLTYTVMCLDITGNAYWWPSPGKYGIPDELWALPSHLVTPQFTTGQMVPEKYQFGGVLYPKESLIRFRRLSAKNPYGQGYSPLQAAIEYARLESVWVSSQDDMLSNGPRPSVIVSHKDPKGAFGPAERKRLEEDMNTKGRGGRSGSAFVVDGPVSVTPVSYSPTDVGGMQIGMYDLERIANSFDVPVSMLKTEDVNRANADAGLEQHARNGIEPRCKLIASAMTRWTQSLDSNGTRGWDRLFWAFDPAVKEDAQAEAELHKTYVDMGVITRNEVRSEIGYDPDPDGDELLVSNSLVPLSHAVKPPESPQPPGGGEFGEGEEQEEQDDETKALMDLCGKVLSAIDRDLKSSKPKKPKPDADKPAKKPKKPGGSRGAGTHAGCGTGAGGFKPGNTCATGGHGGANPGPSDSPSANSATAPVLRNRPIAERLAAWKEGDAKVKQLQSLGSKVTAADKAVDDQRAKIEGLAVAYKNAPKGKEKAAAKLAMEEAEAELSSLSVASWKAQKEAREAAQSILDAPRRMHVGLSEGTQSSLSEHQLDSTREGLRWIQRCVSHPEGKGPMELNVSSIPDSKTQRSSCSRDGISLDKHVGPATVVHEIGHHLDYHVPWVDGNARAFLHHRVGNEQPTQLKTVLQGRYRKDEYGKKDNFDRALGDSGWYAGKAYDDGMTEITSMGLEKMYTDPVGFATKDPEYAKYILGIMHGPLR